MRRLTSDEIGTLKNNNCQAENWETILVDANFDVNRVQSIHFYGEITIGNNTGTVIIDGISQPCQIKNAVLKDCEIGDNVYIADIGSSIQNYKIGNNVVIQGLFSLVADENAQFGNGVKVSVLNEAGGREVTLFNGLNSQIAYLQAIYKYDDHLQNKLDELVQKSIRHSAKGTIDASARLRACKIIRNVNIGLFARIEGAAELVNGTVLSCSEHPVVIGLDVIIKDFVVSEGAEIRDGSILEKVFIGQGVRVGKQFSAENSLFFANCEAYHSEACSVFAGPYTVTHHRSTLLIGCLFSFYNAGSGTNQSNHMYKLGPVHQGVFERGCKTGSFSYLLLESHVPAFSVVIGKHMTNVDIPFFPFSYLSEEHSASNLIPGKNLFSIGTSRDASKWPARDRRKGPIKRDLLVFDVFSPFTIEKMRRGREILQKLYEETDRGVDYVDYGGVKIKRLLLRKGGKYYTLAIDRYLIDKVLCKIEEQTGFGAAWTDVAVPIAAGAGVQHPEKWVDLAGLLALEEKVGQIIQKITAGKTKSVEELTAELNRLYDNYHKDEWTYVCAAFEQEYGIAPDQLSPEKALELARKWGEAASSLNALTVADAKIEFGDFSRIGFGLSGNEEQKRADFEAVRGSAETNAVIQQCEQEGVRIKERLEKLTEYLERAINK